MRFGRRAWLILLPALALYGTALIRVLSGSTGFLTGGIFLASLVGSAVAVYGLYPARSRLFNCWELLALSLVALFSFALYAHDATAWYFAWIGDEWSFYEAARTIGEDPTLNIFQQSGVYNIHPVMDSVFQSSTMHLFGPNVLGWRASGAVAFSVTVFPLYLLARLVGSRLAACIAVSLYVPCHVVLAYAHIGYNQPDAVFPLVAALAAFVAARVYVAPRYLFLAGIFAGVGWYTFFSARAGIALILIGLLIYRSANLRSAARDVGLILTGFGMVLLPFVIVNGRTIIVAMQDPRLLSNPQYLPLSMRLSQNAVSGLYAFVYLVQNDGHYVVGALFDNVSAFFWILGIAAFLTRRNAHSCFVLICYILLLILNGILYYVPHLNTTRTYIVVPLACVVGGLGGASAINFTRRFLPAGAAWRPFQVVAVAGIATAVLVSNLYLFYNVTPSTLSASPQALEMKVIQDHPGATIVEAGDFAHEGFPIERGYGVSGRVLLALGSLAGTLSRARARGKPIIVVSPAPLPPTAINGRPQIVWDQAHIQHIVETDLPWPTSSSVPARVKSRDCAYRWIQMREGGQARGPDPTTRERQPAHVRLIEAPIGLKYCAYCRDLYFRLYKTVAGAHHGDEAAHQQTPRFTRGRDKAIVSVLHEHALELIE
jgi:hypothetical protein